jgi:hypothetical protein
VHSLPVPLQQVRPRRPRTGPLRRTRSYGILPGWRPARCRRFPRRILQRPLRQSTPMQINPDRHPRYAFNVSFSSFESVLARGTRL